MIQRIQSLYLLICTILPIVFIWFIYQNALGVIILALPDNFDIILVLNVLTSIISFVTIFYYKRRKTQFVLCRLNILLNFSILACFYFVYIQDFGLNFYVTEELFRMEIFDIVNLIPIICIFLLVAANRAIKKDEDLIKSMDRIR
tara:strand:+ start:27 stop:461 length:435 start_codon:yes stop_codon:yes gene_type:complete